MTNESPGAKLNYLWHRRVKGCEQCALSKERESIVFGEGSSTADVMFVGEGPGFVEDKTGRPFVGRAGKLLDRWLSEVGLNRGDVYITNVVKCRPPNNRDPEPEEVRLCSRFLRVQIALIQPKILIALGRFAGSFLADYPQAKMRDLRSRAWRYSDEKAKIECPVACVYHPAYVLRQGDNPETSEAYKTAVEDLREALKLMESGTLPDPRNKPVEDVDPEPETDFATMFGGG